MASPPAKAAAESSDGSLSCADWQLQMKLAEKRNERWESRCKKIIKRYRNEHYDQDSERSANSKHGMNVLWSNVETLMPSVYGREPVPIAERRFLDKDVVGRVASQILERAMRYEMGDCGFHDTALQGVKDYLLVGRGVAWLRFKPVIGPDTSLTDRGDDDTLHIDGESSGPVDAEVEDADKDGSEQTFETPQEKVLSAGVEVDYVHWSDFLTSKARFWKEVEWVARKLYLSRDDLCDEFGDEIGDQVPLEMSPEQDEIKSAGQRVDNQSDSMRKAIVYEIWHKPTRKVYTIAKDFDKYLEEPREDPLNLECFWPVPKPLFATMTNDTLEPVPDYLEYQDQALQIDEITNRISLLTKALKVAGVYDASNKNLARLLDEGNENKLIPVQNWAALSEKGGLDKAISFVPIKEIADVLTGLIEARDKVKQDMFEITGLADVIRGQADPRETAAAVRTKGRWGSLRLQARQAAVARWCCDIVKMMGEIISEHYPLELLINVSGAMYDEGIGHPAPEPPVKPDPVASPMLGHNGGPPLSQPGFGGGPPHPMAAMGTPGVPVAAPIPVGPAGMAPAGQGGLHPTVGPANPGNGFNGGGLPNQALGPVALPPPTPEQQYSNAMMQYAQAMEQHKAEKLALIARAIELLKSEKLRGFRIDIETDSTIQNDAEEDKASRIAFIEAVTKFVQTGAELGVQQPDAVPMLGKMLLFGVRGFRAGRDLESSIEEFVDHVEKKATQAKNAPPQPNPEMMKAQADLVAAQAKSQAEIQKAQIEAKASDDDNRRAIMQKQLDMRIAEQKAALEAEKMRQELVFKGEEHKLRLEEMRMKFEADARAHAMKSADMERQAALAAHTHSLSMELAEKAHQHKMAQMKKPKKVVAAKSESAA